jgi:hypothetical protein
MKFYSRLHLTKKTNMKTYLTLVLCLVLGTSWTQNTGSIMGTVFEKETKNTIPGAIITVENSLGVTGYGMHTDVDGRYRINGVEPGVYNVRFKFVGRNELLKTQVQVTPEKITFVDAELQEETRFGKTLVIEEQKIPLIDKNGGTLITLTSKEMTHLPSAHGGNIKNIVAGMISDVKTGDRGEELYFRGSRAGSVVYYIDGVKVRENVPNIPSSGIASISVYTGGMPAVYGDSTGGVVVINTKSYIQEFYNKLNK